MAGGLAALLDDVALLAKMASAASTKAVGVVIDDTAVTPQYVQGFSPSRELPIIWKIARGSLINKLFIILPVAMLLSQFAPWLLTPLLMIGGTYLCFEGAEKLYEHLHPELRAEKEAAEPVLIAGPEQEKLMVRQATTTDLILSTEIMVISLNQVASASFWPRLATMIIVALLITALVYGVVALLVKTDDIGLAMSKRANPASQRTGRLLVDAMPKIMTALSTVGMFAMIWVGGHILVQGCHDLGWHWPKEAIHHLSDPIHEVATVGPALAWLVDTVLSLAVGILTGALVVGLLHIFPIHRKDPHGGTAAPQPAPATSAPDAPA